MFQFNSILVVNLVNIIQIVMFLQFCLPLSGIHSAFTKHYFIN